ncbi:unnamed protein product [Periconia digitata]|uniref:BTB domain-containing protein n=1 Tax=Periconia digitata TaxID=1303443 RepID=A0A9W4UPU7_9PLEO|nr:unnamed protein product [Periconia digitata]
MTSETPGSAASGARGPSEDGMEASSKKGMEAFENSQVLSDVVIRYGAEGERVFYGHQVVLAAQSPWFHEAFCVDSKKKKQDELVLKDDDPEALEIMLRHMYSKEKYSKDAYFDDTYEEHDDYKSVLLHLRVDVVAEKYKFEKLQQLQFYADGFIESSIDSWIIGGVEAEQFMTLVRELYANRDSATKPQPLILQILLERLKTRIKRPRNWIDKHNQHDQLQNLRDVVKRAVLELPVFSQDLFIELADLVL